MAVKQNILLAAVPKGAEPSNAAAILRCPCRFAARCSACRENLHDAEECPSHIVGVPGFRSGSRDSTYRARAVTISVSVVTAGAQHAVPGCPVGSPLESSQNRPALPRATSDFPGAFRNCRDKPAALQSILLRQALRVVKVLLVPHRIRFSGKPLRISTYPTYRYRQYRYIL